MLTPVVSAVLDAVLDAALVDLDVVMELDELLVVVETLDVPVEDAEVDVELEWDEVTLTLAVAVPLHGATTHDAASGWSTYTPSTAIGVSVNR